MLARRPLNLLLATALVVATTPAQAQFGGLGGIFDKAQKAKKVGDSMREIGPEEEEKIGGDLASMILGAAPLVDNDAEQHYVNRVGMWLAMHTDRADLPWHFGIVDTDDVNAFSTPGGYVFITRGLFERFRNESELAGVLAHEIAHVVQKHHLHALQNEMRTSAVADAGSSVVGSGGVTGFLTDQVIKAGKTLYTRGLDKNDEYEADRMGVVIAARAGYSPYGLVGVHQTLSAEQDQKGLALMMKTHPNPADRIERLDKAMGTKLDGLTPVADDLPSFEALRNPPPPPVVKAPAKAAGKTSTGKAKPRKK
ncbi:MAG TPA: M48 family metallopeptidase [Burkholderiales bacterium]|nr:M48 family metallopeptidase [Burkholderiales bacterium]